MPVSYEVKLEVFEGPIDLLYHLITRQRVDIYEVSLATITEEYLAAVGDFEAIDLETATGFLVVAATLLELKSARLLPTGAGLDLDESLLEERDLLLARLVECATYRASGAYLKAGLERGEGFHGRSVTLEPDFMDLAPDVLAGVTTTDLARAAARVLAPTPVVELDTSHVAPITASVKDAIVEVVARLQSSGGSTTFEALTLDVGPRLEVVVRFLALLELFKAGAVDLGQAERFGSIEATWTGEVDLVEVIESAEEYTIAPKEDA